MPAHKSNHFVPKCHFRPFAVDAEGKAINLLNINSSRVIDNASIKDQCAKDYLYGRDGALEKVFQKVEGQYSALVKRIESGDIALSQTDLDGLRDFMYFQYSRTEHAIRRTQIAYAEMDSMIYEAAPEQQEVLEESDTELMLGSMRMFVRTRHAIADLKTCIIYNKTDLEFVTSDDPAILTNRFAQRQPFGKNGAGLTNAGAMLFLPITPKHCVLSYDAGVYTVPEKRGCIVTTIMPRDIVAINELQYLKAYKNIYFHNWESRGDVLKAFNLIKNDRPEKWFQLHYAIFEREDDDSTLFREVHTKKERLSADRALINVELKHPEPKNWCSKIKLRQTPRYIDTKSGAGLIRRALIGKVPRT